MSSDIMVSMSTLQRKITEGNSNWEYRRPRLSGKIAALIRLIASQLVYQRCQQKKCCSR